MAIMLIWYNPYYLLSLPLVFFLSLVSLYSCQYGNMVFLYFFQPIIACAAQMIPMFGIIYSDDTNPLFKIRKYFEDSYAFGTLLFIYPTKNVFVTFVWFLNTDSKTLSQIYVAKLIDYTQENVTSYLMCRRLRKGKFLTSTIIYIV